MRVMILATLAALTLSACGAQTIIANKRQAVIESWSPTGAVAEAEKACGAHGSWPLLQRQSGAEYWFACQETDETRAARAREEHQVAMNRAQELRSSTASMSMPRSHSVAKAAKPKKMAPTGSVEKPPVKKRSKPRGKMTKGYWVQLGAFKSAATAGDYIAAIRKAHRRAIKGHKIMLTKRRLGARGSFHMAHLGPYKAKTNARRTCARLKAGGAACFVTARR
jgi:cell division protein FtsN